ncbi:Trehalose utilization [Anatilimnocola aggregata]|uniref:Trehalose utilization n=1 Tax=Anatilimnocola aggregata TaxID=2528021 RepID=A0A517YM47_9BACT|nr:PVC-type heme-binding CxxCH protein [Anatilimnocola aggregata]QDU31300.1 Trehalose utilization [Anatilimnocola aggregata]
MLLFSLRSALMLFVGAIVVAPASAADATQRLNLLFLGDKGHHQPEARFKQIMPVLKERGIDLTYTEKMSDLNKTTLGDYDGLVIYANTTEISPEQEKALLEYIEAGKGFVPLHCASYCFLNSPKYIALVGAQFKRHGTGTFRTQISEGEHPLMRGFGGFESWDETYVHDKHNPTDRTVLEYREDKDGKEPWTWVRTHGDGRVFYTAWGHDQRTWGNPGFQNLLERGIRWAVKDNPAIVPVFADRPQMTKIAKDVKPFEYVDADVPYYPAGKKWGSQDAGKWQMQLPVTPAESMKHIVTPVGFHVELFVSEPELQGKPICMNWDERGRLWVCETVDYPNELQKPGAGRDRIRICEDTDGDGRADKFTVFAERLSIPTSLVFCRGGVIVHQAPDTLFLKDEDGDDKCDTRKVLFTGWSTGDTHAGPSNLRYGLDNWYYGMVGYAGFDGEIAGQRQSFRTGFYRFKVDAGKNGPEVTQFEFLRNTNNNSWGVGISEEGILLGSTANGNPSVYMPIANRYYEQVRGWSSSVLGSIAEDDKFHPITDKVREVDHHGSFTAAAGHAIYTARTYPREYWNRTAFVTDPTGHLAATFVLNRNGADFSSKNSWNLLASDDEWTAPIMAEVGPDGHVWVIDWYNYIVQHNPTPAGFKNGRGNAYETNLRDKKHGRIYRVVYTAADKQKHRSLKDASAELLVDTLSNDNMFWRLHAQRLLVEQSNGSLEKDLSELIRTAPLDAAETCPAAMHGLWVLQAITQGGDQLQFQAAIEASLKHSSAGVRCNAVLAAVAGSALQEAIVPISLSGEADGQVRLAMLLALSELRPTPISTAKLIGALKREDTLRDRWLLDAATAAAANNAEYLLNYLLSADAKLDLSNPLLRDRVSLVAQHFARGENANTKIGKLLVAATGAEQAAVSTILAGFEKGWPRGNSAKLSDEQELALASLLKKVPATEQSTVISLARKLGSQKLDQFAGEIAASLLKTVENAEATDTARVDAAKQLVEFRKADAEVAGQLLSLLSPRISPQLATGLIEATAKSESPATGKALLASLAKVTPAVRPAVMQAIVSRGDWTKTMLDAAEASEFSLTDLSLDQKQSLASHPDRTLRDLAKKLLAAGGGLPNADRQKVIEELASIGTTTGDPIAGKAAFKKVCAKCHTHSGEGTKVGPDLTGMAVHPKRELMIHMLDPSRSVEGNYRVFTVLIDDGRVLTGLLASESKTAIELIDAEGKKHAIQRDQIEELAASTKSLMPEGFEKQLTKVELTDLLEFMTQRGKFLPIPLDKVASIVTTKGMFYDEKSAAERLVFADWSPKTFEGVPFQLIDPQGDRVPNAILFYGPSGKFPPTMPKGVMLPCNAPVKAIHLLSGVAGWASPLGREGSTSLIVRLRYEDGSREDHELKNGEHFADYIRRVDVPGSKFAFQLRGQQLRYLSVAPQKPDKIAAIELLKGNDDTAPIVMAVTVETLTPEHK